MRRVGTILGVLTLTAALGCGKSETPSESAAPEAPAAPAVDEASAATVTGKVVLDGAAPANAPIKMSADPVCMRAAKGPQTQEFYVVGDGGSLGNVFVYVKDGLGSRTFPVPNDIVKLDQQGCRYTPHVFGIQVNQPLEIVNSDSTLHNIHAIPKNNDEFNTGQPVQGMKHSHKFTAKEVMVPFKCDVHPWMNAYAGVLDHPYYAVSATDGKFELKSLPPGEYTVEAWHEKLGALTQKVTVGAKETKDITFTFKAAGGAATD